MTEWAIRNDGGGRFVLMEGRVTLGEDERVWRDVATLVDWITALRVVRRLRSWEASTALEGAA